MDETAEKLRFLIAAYRARIDKGGGLETITFCLQGIQDAERKLRVLEESDPDRKGVSRRRRAED
jgi:hypothetical protein